MSEHLSNSERARLEALCAEAATEVPRLTAEVRRWQGIAGRLGLSLEDALDLITRLDGRPREPMSADWRDVEKSAAEASLAELWYAQRQPRPSTAATPRGHLDVEQRPPGWQSEYE